MEIFSGRRRRYEARVAGGLFAVRLALDGLFAAVGAAHPIAPALEQIRAHGTSQLVEVGASVESIERFTHWMRGFIAASKRQS